MKVRLQEGLFTSFLFRLELQAH